MIIFMNRIYLSASEKQKLEDLHKHTRDSYVYARIKAILLSSEGGSLVDIAIVLRRHVTSISRFIDDYKNNNKLKLKNGGSKSHLNQEQTKDFISHLEHNIYLTVSAIKEYILTKWNI